MNVDSPAARDLLAKTALAEIPKLLTLQDRNPHSPTYGCFDRNYWHYRVIDFPCGMSQEFVWPLALATVVNLPGNPYFNNGSIRECARAGVLFAVRNAHSDGSCDDYFPNEQAMGAVAFTMLACAESCQLLGIQSEEFSQFIERRAEWLANREEAGRLSNHHALVALGLDVAGRLLNTDKFVSARDQRLARLLCWQTGEGWFPEYDGFDPGYDTLTLSCLARLHQASPRPELASAITASVRLLANFVHPDGSFGGEYGSRNSYNYFPHGFELAGRWLPEALAVNDRFLAGLGGGKAACFSDDRIVGHHTWNYLLAARDFVMERNAPPTPPPERIELTQAGIIIDQHATTKLYVAVNKGGTFKLFRDNQLLLSDTGVSIRMRNGRVSVTHLVDTYDHSQQPDSISIRGQMGWAKHERMTTPRLILLRLIGLTIGRIWPDAVRGLLQKLLIVGKNAAPFRFERTLQWTGDTWKITDRIEAEDWTNVEGAGIGPDQTSIYVAMSRPFQPGQLQSWIDLTPQVRALKSGEPLIVERSA